MAGLRACCEISRPRALFVQASVPAGFTPHLRLCRDNEAQLIIITGEPRGGGSIERGQ